MIFFETEVLTSYIFILTFFFEMRTTLFTVIYYLIESIHFLSYLDL